MANAHTPTPWRTEWNPTEKGEPATLIMQAHAEMWEKWVATCSWGEDGGTEKDGDGRRDCTAAEAQANAEFIVQAVNSHAALVAACKMVLQRWTFNNYQSHTHTWHDMADCFQVINAALAKATKPAPTEE